MIPVKIELEIEIEGMKTDRNIIEWEMLMEKGIAGVLAEHFDISPSQVLVDADITPVEEDGS